MRRCRFCRQTTGALVLQPASPDYIPARRGYRALGIGPSWHHAACWDEFVAFETKSRAAKQREFEAEVAELRAQLAATASA